MYIADKYWNNYIGDTDDSLTLVEYLADKRKEEISLAEIFSDLGLDKLNGNFCQHDEPLTAVLENDESEDEPEEHKLMNKALMDFVSEPVAYDVSEMCPEEDMLETAEICQSLRKELYGGWE